jgi:phosphohistidine phosphatase
MGTRFASRRPIATRIISSDAERARSTARFIAQELGYDPEVVITDSRLYLASPQRILDVLAATCAEQDNLMVIGHNPGMTELANQVTDISIDNMPTCAALCLETDVNDWRELASRPGTLVWYDYPKKPPGQ